MAKVTARVQVRGVDLKGMIAAAEEQLADLSNSRWTITEVDLWGSEDIANRDGMATIWSASMTAETSV